MPVCSVFVHDLQAGHRPSTITRDVLPPKICIMEARLGITLSLFCGTGILALGTPEFGNEGSLHGCMLRVTVFLSTVTDCYNKSEAI